GKAALTPEQTPCARTASPPPPAPTGGGTSKPSRNKAKLNRRCGKVGTSPVFILFRPLLRPVAAPQSELRRFAGPIPVPSPLRASRYASRPPAPAAGPGREAASAARFPAEKAD